MTEFSGVEHLPRDFWRYSPAVSFGVNVDFAHINWGELLRPFGNVKTLRLDDGLMGPLSYTLQDGKLLTELLPELNVLEYPASQDPENLFSAVIDARNNAGH